MHSWGSDLSLQQPGYGKLTGSVLGLLRSQHLATQYRAKTDKWGNTLPKNSQGVLLQVQKQGEFSPSGKLNITALKTDIVRPDNKAEANSIDNLNNLHGAKPDYFGNLL